MKKSQSIFLLSGLVPLVAAPIAIVASCSSETKTESQVEAERLNGLIQSSKIKIQEGKQTLDDAKLSEIKNDPNKLLSDYLDKGELALKEDKFTYNIIDLAGVEPKQDANPQPKTLSFKFKVVNKTNDKETYDSAVASVAYQYQATPQSPEQTLINTAIAEIEKAHTEKTFKLKDDKQTITQNEIDTLVANPANFLTQYTVGLPSSIDKSLTTTVKKGNFSVADKATGSKQQADKQQTITFKVTVSHSATKLESDTKDLTFDFTLQGSQQPVQKPETQTNAEVPVASLALNSTPNKDEIKPLVNEAKIFEKKDVIFKQGADLITAASDINTITWEDDSAGNATKIVLKFKVAANKWYGANGQIGTTVKDLSVTITGLSS